MSLVEKKLIVNKLLEIKNCEYLNDELKSYLFLDKIQSRTRVQKKKLIEYLQFGLRYSIEDNHWCLSVAYDVQLQCCTCVDCGGYEMIGSFDVYRNAAAKCLCSCPGYQEIYQENINVIDDAPLAIYM